ncbi:hypothetical protein [Paenibacillus sp. CF384]|uniref:hypothetical protein n=1 Tax=Paenibacillus sp. CF384 TaxID=1884382 RepID=UPI00089A6171|nr:hypothetical protein [Paenibacillus sp. CF384]SDX57657.1 hypothetical protein SAMN05518855_1016158 [Paenibacillus sp. CF384]
MSSNPIKDRLETIPIPPELGQRSRLGIEQAAVERQQGISSSISSRVKPARKRRWIAVAAAIIVILMTAALVDHSRVWAAIQKALQFVPGIGIVKEEDVPMERFVMKQPITVKVGEGTILITGFMSDEEMTYLTMAGTDVPRLKQIEIVNDKGMKFTLGSSTASWGGAQWTSGFWHKGKLDLSGSVKLILPLDPAVEVEVQLSKAATYASYSELGATDTAAGVSITAITDRMDEKARVSLVSRHSDDFYVRDYGIYGVYMHDDSRKLQVTDETGKQLEIEKIPGVSSPASEFFFGVPKQSAGERYTLTLLEISVTYTEEVQIKVPTAANEHLNQTFEIAGFPVTITKVERVKETGLRIYLDMHYDEHATASLFNFSLNTSSMVKLDEQTGEASYMEFDMEPGSKKVSLKIIRPEVVIRGPWTFELNPS